ncbi:MAG: adenylyltransferase/cytidyltransferase family protein [Spirochaetes bacterium]|nr:adenylyltransferase/cytidyltransferase family protein [Spirochaetota bacterium]
METGFGNIYTAGVFDLFHASHAERITIILGKFPGRHLIIGVASDAYVKSFKRAPVQHLEERINTIKAIYQANKRVSVIVDPLKTYTDKYTASFYNKYNITDHCQRDDWDENPKVYEYIKSKKGFHEIGQSNLISKDELISRLMPSEVIELGGDNNINFRIGNIAIKKIIHGSISFIDDAYTQLRDKKLFGITHFKRFYDMIFIPFIEGVVTPDISVKEIMDLTEQIAKSGLKPTITIMDVFRKFDYVPDKDLYAPLLNDITHICHGDLAYTNIVKGPNGLIPIDWEWLCYSVPYWDLANFLTSLYIYGHNSLEEILEKTKEVPDPKLAMLSTMLLCDYWLQWSVSAGQDFFPKECRELLDFLTKHY